MSDANESARRRMVHRDLETRGIRSPRVLEAMSRVPRERFVSPEFLDEAYADEALPIDCQQTISQPYMVAKMTEALELAGGEKVLEIGTGSGYQTAVLAEMGCRVVSMERHAALHQSAKERLAALGYGDVELLVGDGSLGCPQQAPFDRILVTAAAAEVPPALFDQLAEGGILVGPFGGPREQVLQAIRKVRGEAVVADLTACRFVPLVQDGPQP